MPRAWECMRHEAASEGPGGFSRVKAGGRGLMEGRVCGSSAAALCRRRRHNQHMDSRAYDSQRERLYS